MNNIIINPTKLSSWFLHPFMTYDVYRISKKLNGLTAKEIAILLHNELAKDGYSLVDEGDVISITKK
jgi:hypothetical protein